MRRAATAPGWAFPIADKIREAIRPCRRRCRRGFDVYRTVDALTLQHSRDDLSETSEFVAERLPFETHDDWGPVAGVVRLPGNGWRLFQSQIISRDATFDARKALRDWFL
jgi:hypothetical protein